MCATYPSWQGIARSDQLLARQIVIAVWFVALATSVVAATNPGPRDSAIEIVDQIRRADYDGDRAALKRLGEELDAGARDQRTVARLRYWRGFALWRRSINGFNDSVDQTELEQDLVTAAGEFRIAIAADPDFVDAKIALVSCLLNEVFINQADRTRVKDLLSEALPFLKEAEEADPDNPRLAWVVGSSEFYRPANQGGGQVKAIETYKRGLEAFSKRDESSGDPLEPSWGKPELLMNLAWSNLHATTPDLKSAKAYAEAALDLVPYWHYVRDILLPQIRGEKAVSSIISAVWTVCSAATPPSRTYSASANCAATDRHFHCAEIMALTIFTS
ncbi:MAG: hypothetical protein ACJ8KX_07180 [Chthoniobacterales bacterium]